MKTLITTLLFSIFLSISALLSEYSLNMMKNNIKPPTSLSKQLSFFYGWVKCNGESHFFVQQGYYHRNDCDTKTISQITQKVQKKLINTLGDKYHQINVVKVEGAGCFDDIKKLNSQKKKLLQNKNKARVIKVTI